MENILSRRAIRFASVLFYLVSLMASPLKDGLAATQDKNRDFLATPTIPPEMVQGMRGKGVLLVFYREGIFTELRVLQSSGNAKLDKVALRHVRKTYQLRPGASGSVKVPFRVGTVMEMRKIGDADADFQKAPELFIPDELRNRLPDSLVSGRAEIRYSHGSIVEVIILKTTGLAALDETIVRHILRNFRVKAGSSGRATLPIDIRL